MSVSLYSLYSSVVMKILYQQPDTISNNQGQQLYLETQPMWIKDPTAGPNVFRNQGPHRSALSQQQLATFCKPKVP